MGTLGLWVWGLSGLFWALRGFLRCHAVIFRCCEGVGLVLGTEGHFLGFLGC